MPIYTFLRFSIAQATPRLSTCTHLHSPCTTTTLWQSSRQRRWPGPSFPLSIATHHCPLPS